MFHVHIQYCTDTDSDKSSDAYSSTSSDHESSDTEGNNFCSIASKALG